MSTASADYPRVSTVLRVLDDSYADIPEAVLARAAERGEKLHRLCLSYLASLAGLCAKPAAIPDEFNRAYLAFVQWVAENHVEPIAVEQEAVCSQHRYRGTPDALVLFGAHKVLAILDLKFTAAILRINRVQIQAYWRLDEYKTADRVMLLHINPTNGDLKPHKIPKNPHDWAGFLNALSVWRWRQA